jgi:hypothetical protein
MLERSSWIISLHLGSSIVNGGSLNAGEEQLDYIPPFFVEAEKGPVQVDHRYVIIKILFMKYKNFV